MARKTSDIVIGLRCTDAVGRCTQRSHCHRIWGTTGACREMNVKRLVSEISAEPLPARLACCIAPAPKFSGCFRWASLGGPCRVSCFKRAIWLNCSLHSPSNIDLLRCLPDLLHFLSSQITEAKPFSLSIRFRKPRSSSAIFFT